MTNPDGASRWLDETLARLRRERLLVIELGDLADLVAEPRTEPFVRQRGPAQPGVDDLAATLVAGKELPDELRVRVIVPHGSSPDRPVPEVQAALRSRAAQRASAAWRDAMTVRSMGSRQLPLGLASAVLSWVIASTAAVAATSTDNNFVMGMLIAGAGILLILAWVVSWMVLSNRFFAWRPDGHKASAYELIARCSLEITYQDD